MRKLLFLVFLLVGIFYCHAENAKSSKPTLVKTSQIHSTIAQQLAKLGKNTLIGEYEFSNFSVAQFFLPELAHYSYILWSKDKGILVDPGRDLQIYKAFAKEQDIKIIGVFLTHLHADFVAGHTQAQAELGCPIYISKTTQVQFKHRGLADKAILKVGDAILKVITTPGHTPGASCGFIYGNDAKQPECIFTGDTLFVGSVGRPDLLGENIKAAELAKQLYLSLWQKILKVRDNTVIFPTHGFGSLCGSKLSEKPYSTIGQQKKENSYLQFSSQHKFTAAVLSELPPAPQYFAYNAKINQEGPKVIDWKKLTLPKIRPFKSLASLKYYVVDIRSHETFEKGHIPGSISMPATENMATWVGQIVPFNYRLVLVIDNKEELADAALRLIRIGYRPYYLYFKRWLAAKRPIAKSFFIDVLQAAAHLNGANPPVVIDVRSRAEFDAGHIPNSKWIPLTQLLDKRAVLNPKKPALVVCRSGFRSGIAMGLLSRYGFKNIATLKGGFNAWKNAKQPIKQSVKCRPENTQR